MDIQSKFEGEKQKQQPLNPPFYWDLCLYLWHLVCIFYSSIRIKPYHQQRFAKLFCAEVDLRNIFALAFEKATKLPNIESYLHADTCTCFANFRKSLSVVTMRLNVWCFPSWLKMVLCVLNSRWSIGFATSKSLNAQTWFQMSASSIKIENTLS